MDTLHTNILYCGISSDLPHTAAENNSLIKHQYVPNYEEKS